MATGRLLETLEGTKQHLTYRHVDARNLKKIFLLHVKLRFCGMVCYCWMSVELLALRAYFPFLSHTLDFLPSSRFSLLHV